MDNEQRITSLEQTLTEMLAKEADTQNKLDILISRLPMSTDPISPTPDIPLQPRDLVKKRKVRPASPPDFDGDCTKGLAFLNSCQTYVQLCPEEFENEQTVIVWAMSYMKTGRAEKWAARVFRWEQEPTNRGNNRFVDWAAFRVEFKKEFCPAHSDSAAIN